jgi:hypothetical protein
MSIDIQNAVSGVVIKNGTVLVSTTKGKYITLDTYVKNKPSIDEIENKYDNRLDKVRYYTGDSAS